MTKRKKDEGGRGYYSWSAVLENYLIESMVELAKGNHIGNGSFKGGAFKELETLMELKSPECESNPSCRDLNGLPYPPYDDLLLVFGSYDDEATTRFMENIVNEVDMPNPPILVPNVERANSTPNVGDERPSKVAACKIQLESSIEDLKVEVIELRPAMDRAFGKMISKLCGEDISTQQMRQSIIADLENLSRLTHHQAIDACTFLSRDENARDLQV
ncbi:hypothetical protein LINGRAHAP2_LOCUS778 [Linum grandiflorum]